MRHAEAPVPEEDAEAAVLIDGGVLGRIVEAEVRIGLRALGVEAPAQKEEEVRAHTGDARMAEGPALQDIATTDRRVDR